MKIGNQDSSLYFELIAHDSTPPGLNWRTAIECKDTEGFTVLMREIDWDNETTMARTDYTMQDVKIEAYEMYLEKMEEELKTMPAIKEFKILDKDSNGGMVYYYRQAMKPPAPDRDNLIRMSRLPQEDGSVLRIWNTIDMLEYPVHEGCSRMDMYRAQMMKEVGNILQVTEFMNFSVRGQFMPKVNFTGQLATHFQQKWVQMYQKLVKFQQEIDAAKAEKVEQEVAEVQENLSGLKVEQEAE